jgi:hypothetical protein
VISHLTLPNPPIAVCPRIPTPVYVKVLEEASPNMA